MAREKELRALAAEKDVLSQQARAAWALLDERSAAAHELEVPCVSPRHPRPACPAAHPKPYTGTHLLRKALGQDA